MPTPSRSADRLPDPTAVDSLSPGETARYIREMLDSLRRIAIRQDQLVLAGLLEAASREAKRLVANSF